MSKRFKPQFLPYNDDAHALVEASTASWELLRYLLDELVKADAVTHWGN